MRLFLALLEDGGQTSLAVIAQACGVPASTARRSVTALLRLGLLTRMARGRYGPGVRLAALPWTGAHAVLRQAARPSLRRLAQRQGATAHLAVLEGDMATYLVKEQAGAHPVLSRELIQLEAYCSGVGKVLLAHLPPSARDAYLAAGPFPALTPNTITDPAQLRAALRKIRQEGYAVDDAELAPGLYCMAVPLRGPGVTIAGAISLSGVPKEALNATLQSHLQSCATAIGRRLGWVAGG